MLDKYLKVNGAWISLISKLRGSTLSEEHTAYLTNGNKCPHCGVRIFYPVGLMFYLDDNSKRPFFSPKRGKIAECQKCGSRWLLLKDDVAVDAPKTEIVEVVETERSEEFLGDDRRIVNNAESANQITRSFSFSREWSKSCQLDIERAQGGSKGLNLGVKDTAALTLTAETKLRQTYSVSQDSKEVCTEEVSCQVSAHTNVTIVVRWKRIWQHGLIKATQNGVPLLIPFRVAVAMTFDQQQIDEKSVDLPPQL